MTSGPPGPSENASITGLCFQPKALIIWPYIGGFGNGGGFRPPAAYFYNSWGDAAGEAGLSSHWDSGTVAYGAGIGTSYEAGYDDSNLVSFDADGFTLHFRFHGTHQFYWTAIGGDELEAYAGTFTIGAGDTSPVAVTGVGFQPDFLFAATTYDNGIGGTVSHGMTSGPSNQAAISSSMSVFATSLHTLLNGYLLCPRHAYSPDVYYQAQLASFDADGFTVDVPFNPGDTNSPHFLAIRDPSTEFSVGVDTQNTSTGAKATTGVGFKPGGGLFLGSYKTSDNDFTYATAPSADAMLSVGAADGLLNQQMESEWNISGGFGGHDQNWYTDGTTVMAIGNNAAALIAAAAVDSWDSDGFTLDWTVSDGVARYFIYGVFKTERVDPCVFMGIPALVGEFSV